MLFYARSREDIPESRWQTIEEHSNGVAGLGRAFAARFDAAAWGHALGLLHDLGKYGPAFQERIRGRKTQVDHSTAGALWALSNVKNKAFARMLAFCIAGHHTGLPDGSSGSDDTCLDKRLAGAGLPEHLPPIPHTELETPPFVTDQRNGRCASFGFSAAFFIRMLFSCLKDADCLDSEAFLEPEKRRARANYPALAELRGQFHAALQERFAHAEVNPLNDLRNKVRGECIAMAEQRPGLFSLTVPTGGGKTLSSMAFALHHAVRHGLDRIIYVIPYTSIIEQTAGEFKEIFGRDNVVEHHSNYGPAGGRDDDGDESESKRLLATENWDAPIVVTTNVQFFESLFHNKTSRLRKIHNIAASVIVLDEAQMLPVPYLRPTIEALRELTDRYHATVVLCTATQPALNEEELKGGLRGVREIVKEPARLEKAFKRVRASFVGTRTDEQIADELKTLRQVLCIVNTRVHARLLAGLLGEEAGHFHLSALMCPQHRSLALDDMRLRLRRGETCRVISTQLVEAGVDIDFPVVYRAMAGLDSIVQSAGRCNRESKLAEGGLVRVFLPAAGLPRGPFRQAAEITQALLSRYPDDLLSVAAVKDYFNELYWLKNLGNSLDEKRILEDCRIGEAKVDFPFKGIAGKYRLIDQAMESIIIPFDEAARSRIEELRAGGARRDTMRALQRYTVGVYPQQFFFLRNEGFIETIEEFCHILSPLRYKEAYSHRFGLNPDCKEFCDPESLCV